MTAEPKKAIHVFFCYAREDEPLLDKLKTHLIVLQRQKLIDMWHDRNINVGTEWEREIDKHLNSSDIILLLISPDFMASEYCYSVEMERAMQRHERGEAQVIPVILRSVYFKGAPFGKLQALPTDAKPILSSHWPYQDEAFFSVAEGVREAAERFLLYRRFIAAYEADDDNALTFAYNEIQSSPYQQSIILTPQQQQRVQLAQQRSIALQRFRDALAQGKLQEIVSASETLFAKDKVFTNHERQIVGLAQGFVQAFNAGNSLKLVAAYDAIKASSHSNSFVFSQTELQRVEAAQRLMQSYLYPTWTIGTCSDPGITRKYKPNEDSVFAAHSFRDTGSSLQRIGLFIVADGESNIADIFAGTSSPDWEDLKERPGSGQQASRMAIQTIIDYILPRLSFAGEANDEQFTQLMVSAVQAAHEAIYQWNQEQDTNSGSTVTAVLAVDMRMYVANVGDSRTYLLRNNKLALLTKDHSLVMRLVEAKQIDLIDIYTHPQNHLIYRCLGARFFGTMKIDVFSEALQLTDKLLLSSDGLWKMVRGPKIESILKSFVPVDKMCQALVHEALTGGGEDNVSVIVTHVAEKITFADKPGIQVISMPEGIQIPQL